MKKTNLHTRVSIIVKIGRYRSWQQRKIPPCCCSPWSLPVPSSTPSWLESHVFCCGWVVGPAAATSVSDGNSALRSLLLNNTCWISCLCSLVSFQTGGVQTVTCSIGCKAINGVHEHLKYPTGLSVSLRVSTHLIPPGDFLESAYSPVQQLHFDSTLEQSSMPSQKDVTHSLSVSSIATFVSFA